MSINRWEGIRHMCIGVVSRDGQIFPNLPHFWPQSDIPVQIHLRKACGSGQSFLALPRLAQLCHQCQTDVAAVVFVMEQTACSVAKYLPSHTAHLHECSEGQYKCAEGEGRRFAVEQMACSITNCFCCPPCTLACRSTWLHSQSKAKCLSTVRWRKQPWWQPHFA